MADLELKNIWKSWADFVAVKNFHLKIADKEFLVLLGPSGCGKTTTMRMIAGLEDPTQGEIFIGGKKVNDLEPKDRDVSMVFQNYGLYPNLNVYDNICFPLKVRKVSKTEQGQRVQKAAEMVELLELLDRRPAELSGGQRQRVALARAIVRKPNVFLMDEPLSNLDAKLRISTRAQIKNLQYELQVTTVYVTHDQTEAMTLADRVVVMNHGEIQQVGSPLEIYDRPQNTFVAGFIGSPPMNLIQGKIKDRNFVCETNLGFRFPGPEGPVTLGFRAEDAEIVSEGGQLKGIVYAMELLGDATLVTLRIESTLVCVKMPKDFRAKMSEELELSLKPSTCHLFEPNSGHRISPN